MKIIFNWLLSSAAIFITAYLLPGVTLSGFSAALLAAIVLGVATMLIGPFLKLLALPFNFMTLGVFNFAINFVINAILIMIASAVVSGFKVKNFGWALIFALVLSVVKFVLDKYFKGAF